MHVQLDHGCKSDWEKHLENKNITRSASGRPSQQVKGNSTQIRADQQSMIWFSGLGRPLIAFHEPYHSPPGVWSGMGGQSTSMSWVSPPQAPPTDHTGASTGCCQARSWELGIGGTHLLGWAGDADSTGYLFLPPLYVLPPSQPTLKC